MTVVEESTVSLEVVYYESRKRVLKKRRKNIVVYYESRKRVLKTRLTNDGRYDERLKTGVEESTWLTYTGLYDKTNKVKNI